MMLHESKRRQMTEGVEWKSIVLFALPLMLGNLFQQLYNTADSIIVGNFVGKEALAAVGSVDPIINTFIGFFMGLSTGAGVVISQYYGAKDEKQVSKAVGTTICLTAILSILLTVVSHFLLPIFLRFLGTPDDVWNEAYDYLSIYFYGLVGLLFYNMGSGILRAIGDSRRPLYFLILSALMNIFLDILFVAVFGLGVKGVAYATIISQGVSALLVLVVLTLEKEMYRVQWRRIGMDLEILSHIFRIGLPSALQMMITAFSNIFIQSYINHFGSASMAGWSCYQKIDKLCILPMQSISLSTTTFVGQNLGAGKVDRAKRGIRAALILCFVVEISLGTPTWIFCRGIISLFNRDPDVLFYGMYYLRHILPFFLIIPIQNILSSAMAGAGNTRIPVMIMIFGFIIFRQSYLFIITRVLPDVLLPVALGYPAGWIVCSTLMVIYFSRTDLEKYVIVKRDQ